ncbi:putative Cyclin-dependent kinase D-2 [Blattamonas nauphoetae]|uniref:cyclin-dependent kinase n=1 Tax=Blattamonas nauphoetae TaxID=2049346 RepID=A0ABQ9Y2Y6_9EUKA|nr:putative Cyclin-dependent kinase D-2 [Blattamonas nauphoetae]
MNKYHVVSRLGYGTFGEVFKARELSTGRLVAIKTVFTGPPGKEDKTKYERELQSLLALDHKNVLSLIESFTHKQRFIFVMPYFASDLYRVINRMPVPLPESKIKGITLLILRGLAHCHNKRIIHRDIKPSNILISKTGNIILADFGLSRFLNFPPRMFHSTHPRNGVQQSSPEQLVDAGPQNSEEATGTSPPAISKPSLGSHVSSSNTRPLLSHKVVTRFYRSPELLYGSQTYDYSVDVWSVGCIVAELFRLRPLFVGETDIEQLYTVISALGTPYADLDEAKAHHVENHPQTKGGSAKNVPKSPQSTGRNKETVPPNYWPEMVDLPDVGKITFPETKGVPLEHLVPNASRQAISFLKRMLVYSASQRASADELLFDEWFYSDPLPETTDIFPCSLIC